MLESGPLCVAKDRGGEGVLIGNSAVAFRIGAVAVAEQVVKIKADVKVEVVLPVVSVSVAPVELKSPAALVKCIANEAT